MPSIIPTISRPAGAYNTESPIYLGSTTIYQENNLIYGNQFIALTGENADFTNNGMIWMDDEGAFIAEYAGDFVNTGSIISSSIDNGIYAVSFISRFQSFINSGTIVATATNASARAVGDYTGWVGIGDETIYNSGTIAAQGPASARAIERSNGGPVVNYANGAILAEGSQAVAVYIESGDHRVDPGQTGSISLFNAGRIEAVSTAGGTSYGVTLLQYENSWYHLVNEGVIKADFAISFNGYYGAISDEWLENRASGSLIGRVAVGSGNDLFENAGLVQGVVDLGTGNDRLMGGAGTIFGKIFGGKGDDEIHSGMGDDDINGGAGADYIDGGFGADRMFGGTGNDVFVVDNRGDVVSEYLGQGRDRVESHLDSFSLPVNVEDAVLIGDARALTGNGLDNRLKGNAGANTLSGVNGNDTLIGFAGHDFLTGGNGDDWIWGGRGRDIAVGGAGADVFSFVTGDFAGMALSTGDRIADFDVTEGDLIDLTGVDAIDGLGDDAFTFIGSAQFEGIAGQLRYRLLPTALVVEGDTDGDGHADFALFLMNVTAIDSDAFLL